MRTYQKLLLALVLLISAILPVASSYAGIYIDIGDRGYYNHGPWYNDGGYRWYWVPGHWGPRHHWIHGHYRHR